MLTPEQRDKIKAGSKVRIAVGAEVTSNNPSEPSVIVGRPYWVVLTEAAAQVVAWAGSGGYRKQTQRANVDRMEDLL